MSRTLQMGMLIEILSRDLRREISRKKKKNVRIIYHAFVKEDSRSNLSTTCAIIKNVSSCMQIPYKYFSSYNFFVKK